jgi:hypothetical protein
MGRAAERGGAGGRGANCPGPRGAGGPPKIFVRPQSFCVLNISAQRTRYLFFALSTEIWHKNEIKSLESNCNALVLKIFYP